MSVQYKVLCHMDQYSHFNALCNFFQKEAMRVKQGFLADPRVPETGGCLNACLILSLCLSLLKYNRNGISSFLN